MIYIPTGRIFSSHIIIIGFFSILWFTNDLLG